MQRLIRGKTSGAEVRQANWIDARQRRLLSKCKAYKARWSFDAKFGHKQKALKLLQEWIGKIAETSKELTPESVQITHGAIGIPESRIELELEFNELAGIESFWSGIPLEYHRDWTTRINHAVVNGTPQWTVHHIVPMTATKQESLLLVNNSQIDADSLSKMEEQAVILDKGPVKESRDWKGDLMELRPGDKLPFNFT